MLFNNRPESSTYPDHAWHYDIYSSWRVTLMHNNIVVAKIQQFGLFLKHIKCKTGLLNVNCFTTTNLYLHILTFLLMLHCYNQSLNEPCHEIIVLFVLRKLILQTCMHSHPVARCLIFGQTLCLLPYFKCANSKGSKALSLRWLTMW